MVAMTLLMCIRVGALVSIEEGIVPGCVCIEMVWAPYGHDPDMVGNQLLANIVMLQGACNACYVMVGSGVVVAKELNCSCNA